MKPKPSIAAPAEQAAGAAPLSLARRQALAFTQRRAREASAARHANLKVPTPFASAVDFLAALKVVVTAMPLGSAAELARHCEVDTSTAAKWLRGAKIPTQANLDKLIAWWRVNRDQTTPTPVKRSTARGPAQTIALTRLSAPVQRRLERTARLRNLTPIRLAEQILDRHLPSADQLDRESGR